MSLPATWPNRREHTITHRTKDRALDGGFYGFNQLALIVAPVVDPRVMCVIYRLIEARIAKTLHYFRSYSQILSQNLTKQIGGEASREVR
jgi:hypothetical protein